MSASSIVRTLLELAGSGENTGGKPVQEDTAANGPALTLGEQRAAARESLTEQRKRIVDECLRAKEPFAMVAKRNGLTPSAVQQWLNVHYVDNPTETRRHLRYPYGPGPKPPETWVRGETPLERANRRGESELQGKLARRGKGGTKRDQAARAREVLAERMQDPDFKRRIVAKRNRTLAERRGVEPEPTSTTTQLSRPQPPASQIERRQQRLPLPQDDDEPEGYSGPTIDQLRATIERQQREIEILRETAREALEERKTLRGMVEIMQREAAEKAQRRVL